MTRSRLISALLVLCCLLPHTDATIEFIYAVKEKVFEQNGNTQPNTISRWSFGAGASGDSSLTALSITPPGAVNPVSVAGEDGSFDLEGEIFSNLAALDAAYPNGTVSFSVTDNGSTQNLGPFSIIGDAYPTTPYITNAVELQESDYTQDFEVTWNAFTGADEGDQIIFQLWNGSSGEDLVFEFLDSTATSFVIPGGTLTPDNNYDIDLVFVNETDGLESPDTIIGYLTTTTYYFSTSTSDTHLLFYKWQSKQQTASDTLDAPVYRPLTTVTGNTRTVTYAVISTPASQGPYELENIGSNRFRLLTDFGTKENLDSAYPDGGYSFGVIEDSVFTDYGPLNLSGDAYPENPLFQNFSELQSFDASQSQAITWSAAPIEVNLIQVLVLDELGTQVWIESHPSDATTTQLPANILSQGNNYLLAVRFWVPITTRENPSIALGYLSSTNMDIQTSAGGGESGVNFIYTVKERSFFQEGNATSTNPYQWSFAAGVNGGSNVTGGSLDFPGGTENFTGSGSEYNTNDHRYASQEELNTDFPSGQYSLNVTVDGLNQALGPFNLSGDEFPSPPHIINVVEIQSHDYSQSFTILWDAFSESDTDDRIAIEVNDASNNQDLVFEFLDPTATSYEIPGGTLTSGNQYEVDILFVNETDGLESPDTIIGYLSRTKFNISTTNSDTDIEFYKSRRNLQTGPDTILLDGYRPMTTVTGRSTPVTYAEIRNQVGNYPLNFISTNTHLLGTPFGTKESLDNSYPFGGYQFGIIENDILVHYGPYYLGPDAYPIAPLFQNFEELQSFDATEEQTITWNAAPEGVTSVALQVRDNSNSLVWSTELDPVATTTTIPADALTQFESYRLIVQFWARQTGSESPDASLGYLTATNMPFLTYPSEIEYATWLPQFFSENQLLDSDIVGETADPDGDKLSNYFEFLAKLDPSDSNSKLYFDFNDEPGETLKIGPINPGVNWKVQSSVDFSAWSPVDAEVYELIGNEIQIDLQSFLPTTFFQIALTTTEP